MLSEFTDIVVGVDFSPSGRCAWLWAKQVAALSSAQLHAVHVLDPLVISELKPLAGESHVDAQAPIIAQIAERLARDVVATAAQAWLLSVEVGDPADALVQYATVRSADSLVIGAGQDGSTNSPGARCIASVCLRRFHNNLVIAPASEPKPQPKLLLACVDLGGDDGAVLCRAAEFAQASGAELHVAYVFDGPWHVLHYRGPTPQASPHFQRQFTELLSVRLESWCRSASAAYADLDAHLHLIDSKNVTEGILEMAEWLQPDWVFMGAGRPRRLRDWLSRRTVERVASGAAWATFAVYGAEASGDRPTASAVLAGSETRR